MKTKHLLLLILFILSGLYSQSHACTTAVIAAKNSANGRSMISKLRDTDNLGNSMRYFEDGKYNYLGLVNSNDTLGVDVWGGSNSAGFAIMNSASYNVNVGDTTQLKDQEGIFMKLALQTCASLQDLENLLNTYPKPHGLASHFGVIDAHGGAAYYEVNNWTWTKFDANDSDVAPNGYIIRTNYSETGTKDEGFGFIRRETAEKVFAKALQNSKLDHRTVVQRFSRCTYHPVFDINYRQKFEQGTNESAFVASDDFITRHSSASSIIVEGVKPGESPAQNTVWIQIGYPNTTIALPLWVECGKNIPAIVQYNPELKNSWLNEAGMKWKNSCYPLTRSDGYHYLKLDELVNKDKNGFIQRIEPEEKEVFDKTNEILLKWRSKAPSSSEIKEYYDWLENKATKLYGNL